MNGKLRIVLVLSNSPFAYPIPPLNQGGTEKVMYELAEGLVRKGHEVFVFAAKGSTCSGKVIEYPAKLKERQIGRFVAKRLPPRLHIINDFTFTSSVKQLKLPVPTISTHQCPIGWFTRKSIYPSKKMWTQIGKKKGYIVYNGIDPNEYEFSEQKQDYLLFIGRILREKGILEAIEVAEKTGQKLVIAGPVKDEELFRNEIEPVLKRNSNIVYVGAVSGKKKQELLKMAKCMLFPISWEEPFGLVMIESMITGTPVLAFSRGAVPEVLAGFPQFICQNLEEMIAKAERTDFPSPYELRQYVLDHFSREAMTEKYMKIFQKLRKKTGIRRKKSSGNRTKTVRKINQASR